MEKCRYILERDLPSQASGEELVQVENACNQHKFVRFGRTAKEWLANSSVPECQLRGAIIRHIKAGKRVFHKYKDDGSGQLIERDVQANITIFDGHDIYVEIALEGDTLIILYAHEHTPGKPRLPKT
jgi:hypothetical protein